MCSKPALYLTFHFFIWSIESVGDSSLLSHHNKRECFPSTGCRLLPRFLLCASQLQYMTTGLSPSAVGPIYMLAFHVVPCAMGCSNVVQHASMASSSINFRSHSLSTLVAILHIVMRSFPPCPRDIIFAVIHLVAAVNVIHNELLIPFTATFRWH